MLESDFKSAIARLANSVSAWRDPMVRDLCRLLKIPSVGAQPEAGAPYGPETVRALELFLELGKDMGFNVKNLDNRAGYVEFGEGDPLTGVLCHLDVVPPGHGWTQEPFSPVVKSDRIIARGAADDKGPAIAVLYAMKDLLDTGYRPAGRIRLIVGLDEERGSSCMEHYVRVAQLPDNGFTPDASFPVIYAEKGILWLSFSFKGAKTPPSPLRLVKAAGGGSPNMVPDRCEVTMAENNQEVTHHFSGRSGHASTPWLGTNAISQAMKEVKTMLDAKGANHPFVDFYQKAIGDGWDGALLDIAGSDQSGQLTLNAGRLNLDTAGAELIVDIRYPVSWSFDKLIQDIRTKAQMSGVDVSVINHQAPLYKATDSFLVQSLTAVYARMTGQPAEPLAIGGGTYARSMPNIVAFGAAFPGEEDVAHQADEYILIDNWLASTALYREALKVLSGGSSGFTA